MHYKTNRQNHDFQIAYFLAGSCQTPDAAWSLLCDLRDDRQDALNLAKAGALREQAKRVRATKNLMDEDEATRLEAQADLLELDALLSTTQKNIDAAEAELAIILKLQERLQPLRKFAHLPDAEAHEAAQAEEWQLQLIRTAENYMLTQGVIPADHFATMRLHPEFKTKIFPAIEKLNLMVAQAKSDRKSLVSVLPDPVDFVPLLMKD